MRTQTFISSERDDYPVSDFNNYFDDYYYNGGELEDLDDWRIIKKHRKNSQDN